MINIQNKYIMKDKDMRITPLILAAMLMAACIMTGCSVGPDYVKPEMQVPAKFKEQNGWVVAQPQDSLPKGKWWELFGDADLNALAEQVEISNQNIKVAEAQYRQAQALRDQSHAAYFPTVTANLSVTRSRPATNSSNAVNYDPNLNTSYRGSLGASWEPDLWGRVGRSVESGDASIQASAADIENAKLSAQAELAQDYFLLRIADARKQLLDDTVTAYERSLKLTQNQYAVGVVARADVVAAETQLKSAKAQAVDVGVQRAQLEHAIAVLIGKAPSELTIEPLKASYVTLPPNIPLAVPSQLLERRPDVAGAERRAAAANAQIGVAKSAYFPALTIAPTFGYQTSSFSRFLEYPTRFWSIGPALVETIFDGGLRKAQTAQAVATYDQNVATYRQTVLGAFQEVEDSLASLLILQEEAQLQDEAVKASRESVEITRNQYKAGTVDFLSVVNVEAIALNNERTALTIQGSRLTSAVLLVKALGGGWDTTQLDNKPAENK
jgi:NodT family efflux transporter outer membrane factor (OMF) lipoprotein